MGEYRVGWDDERDVPIVLDQHQDTQAPRGPETLSAVETRLLRTFCAWLRQEGLAICRDVGADRWTPIQQSAAALVVAFDAHLQEQEEKGDWGG